MTWIEAYKKYWRKAFVMKGRARRKEYWIPMLINILIAVALSIFFPIILSVQGYMLTEESIRLPVLLWILVTLIPDFTVTVRRLQDININGWWSVVPFISVFWDTASSLMNMLTSVKTDQLLSFLDLRTLMIVAEVLSILSIIIAIVLFIMTVLDGTRGRNKYGEDPKKNERGYQA